MLILCRILLSHWLLKFCPGCRDRAWGYFVRGSYSALAEIGAAIRHVDRRPYRYSRNSVWRRIPRLKEDKVFGSHFARGEVSLSQSQSVRPVQVYPINESSNDDTTSGTFGWVPPCQEKRVVGLTEDTSCLNFLWGNGRVLVALQICGKETLWRLRRKEQTHAP